MEHHLQHHPEQNWEIFPPGHNWCTLRTWNGSQTWPGECPGIKSKLFFSNPNSKGTKGPMCTNCKRSGHTMDWCWAKGGGAEGKGLKMRPSKGNLKGKGKKAGSPKVAKGRQRLPRTTNHHLPHQWCISLMLKLSCLRTHQILGRLTSISTLRPQIIYVTPETIFPHTRNLNPLGELNCKWI